MAYKTVFSVKAFVFSLFSAIFSFIAEIVLTKNCKYCIVNNATIMAAEVDIQDTIISFNI